MKVVDVFGRLETVAQVVRRCPTPVLRSAYVNAMRDWCRETRWLREVVSGQTVPLVGAYSLGQDPHIEIIGVVAVAGSATEPAARWAMTVSDAASWSPAMTPGQPRQYAYAPEGQLGLFPVPDQAYGLSISAVVQPRLGAVQVPEGPLGKYGSAFNAGALAYLLGLKDTPWHNPGESVRQERIFRSAISNGKADVARNFNDGSLRVAPRRFGV